MRADVIAVHGLGYVGLTAAVHYARAGWQVIGYDPDVARVQALNDGHPLLEASMRYVNTGVTVEALVARRLLRATTDFRKVYDIPVHSIAVPTERAGQPYDAIITKSLDDIVRDVNIPMTVLIESTLTPGFVDRYLSTRPGLREQLGHQVFLAVCPRRDWFADAERNLGTLPRIVGGVTEECTRRALGVLLSISPRIHDTDYRTAELCKALENALLHVPVMLAYQLAWALPDRNVAEALRLAGTHWRLTPLYLGFGTGGRCVPLGTEYLVEAARQMNRPLTVGLEALAWDDEFREEVAKVVLGAQPAPKTALVLGVAYRPGFRDAGRSPGLSVAKRLASYLPPGAVTVHDPMWPAWELTRLAGLPALSGPLNANLAAYDAVLLATPHEEYLGLPVEPVWRGGQVVLDGQGAWAQHRELFTTRGVLYRQVGEPGWTDLRRNDA